MGGGDPLFRLLVTDDSACAKQTLVIIYPVRSESETPFASAHTSLPIQNFPGAPEGPYLRSDPHLQPALFPEMGRRPSLPSPDEDAGAGIPTSRPARRCRALGFRPGQREAPEPQPRCCRRPGSDGGRETDGRTEGGRPGRGPGPGYLRGGSPCRLPAVATAARHLQPSGDPGSSRTLTAGTPRQVTRSRPAPAPASASPAAGAGAARSRDPRGRGVRQPTGRAGREDSRPPPAGGGRAWRGRGGRGGCSRTFPRRGPAATEPAGRLTSGYPETLSCFCRGRRRPAAQTPNFRRRRRRLPSDGSYLGPSWVRLRGAPPQPQPARGRRWPPRSLRVTQFPPGPRRPGVGERRAAVHTQRRRGGRPGVRAAGGGRLRGGGSAPCW